MPFRSLQFYSAPFFFFCLLHLASRSSSFFLAFHSRSIFDSPPPIQLSLCWLLLLSVAALSSIQPLLCSFTSLLSFTPFISHNLSGQAKNFSSSLAGPFVLGNPLKLWTFDKACYVTSIMLRHTSPHHPFPFTPGIF